MTDKNNIQPTGPTDNLERTESNLERTVIIEPISNLRESMTNNVAGAEVGRERMVGVNNDPGSHPMDDGLHSQDASAPAEGEIPSPGLPTKKRGRPRKVQNMKPRVVDESLKPFKKRPACENLTNKYPLKKIVFYEDGKDHKGLGVFHDPEKGPSVVLMEILREGTEGDVKIIWPFRVVPNKHGGKPIFHHDMINIRQSLIVPLAKALLSIADEWFGGQAKIDAGRVAYQEAKKKDELGERIRKMGGI